MSEGALIVKDQTPPKRQFPDVLRLNSCETQFGMIEDLYSAMLFPFPLKLSSGRVYVSLA